MDKNPKKPYFLKCERPPERALRRGKTAKMARIVKKMRGPDSRARGKENTYQLIMIGRAQNILKKAVNLSDRGGHGMESLAKGKEWEAGWLSMFYLFLEKG